MANLAIALLALLIAVLSFIVSYKAFQLAQKQDERKRPLLVPSLLGGYVHFRGDKKVRVYAFLLSISNPSDSNNALANIELHITYRMPAQVQVTTRLLSSSSRGDAFAKLSEFSILSTPARLDAHQTLTGWAVFHVSEGILKDATVEGYTVALFDSHGIKSSVEAIMVQEYKDEAIPPLPGFPSSQ